MTNAKNISFEGTRGSMQCILRHLYDLLPGCFSLLRPSQYFMIFLKGSHILRAHSATDLSSTHFLKSETHCIKSPKPKWPVPSKHFQFLPKKLAWYYICHGCSNHSNLEKEAECLTKTIHT